MSFFGETRSHSTDESQKEEKVPLFLHITRPQYIQQINLGLKNPEMKEHHNKGVDARI